MINSPQRHGAVRNDNLSNGKIVRDDNSGLYIRAFVFQRLQSRRHFVAGLRESLRLSARYEQSYIRVFVGDASASRWRYYVA
jgi:hypothetical protein